jgi:hypothetical protein
VTGSGHQPRRQNEGKRIHAASSLLHTLRGQGHCYGACDQSEGHRQTGPPGV